MTGGPARAALDAIVRIVRPGATLVEATPLSGGISSGMTALDVERADGAAERLVLRVPSADTLRRRPRAAECEAALLRRVEDAGVPAPRLVHAAPAGDVLDRPWLVLDWTPGAARLAPEIDDAALAEAARVLAAVHRIDPAGLDLPVVATIPEWVRYAESLDVGKRARDLLSALPALGPSEPRLLHGDFWPGNLVWHGDRLAAVLDWEDSGLGPPLFDLAISRLEHHLFFGPEAADALARHYAAASGRSLDALPHHDLCAALRAAPNVTTWAEGWADGTIGALRPDITPKTFAARLAEFVERAALGGFAA